MKENNLLKSRKRNRLLSTISLILVVFLSVSILSSCGNEEIVEIEKTPIELLTEKELLLFEALKEMSADFYEPAGFKLMEVGDYEQFDKYDTSERLSYDRTTLETAMGIGTFNCIIVRIQGENRVGGTLNHYYLVRLDTLEDYIVKDIDAKIEEEAEEMCVWGWDKENDKSSFTLERYKNRQEYKERWIKFYQNHLEFCSKEQANEFLGNNMELRDSTTIKTSREDIFNISKINKALKYYWDDRLGNT